MFEPDIDWDSFNLKGQPHLPRDMGELIDMLNTSYQAGRKHGYDEATRDADYERVTGLSLDTEKVPAA